MFQTNPGPSYIVFQSAWSLWWALAFTLSMVYQVDVAGLNPMQLIFIGTVLEITCFLGEIPTGIVADLHSRKLSVIIGLVIISIGICIYGAFPAFWPILIAQIIWGVGYTFVSGAAEAWVTDEVGANKVQDVFTRAHQLSLMMNVVGIVLAGVCAFAFDSLQAPMIVGGIGFMATALWALKFMREVNFTPVPREERDNWGQMLSIAQTGLDSIRKPGVLRTFLIIGLLAGLTSEVFDRLWVDRVVNDFSLPNWFGENSLAFWFTAFALVASLVGLVASVVANKVANAALNAEHPTIVMALLSLLQIGGIAGFAVAGNLGFALAGRWLYEAAISVGWPIRQAWLNRNVESRARATTVSLMGQADAVGQVAGGPSFGALANAAGVPVALLAAGVAQLPTVWLYSRLKPDPEEQCAKTNPDTTN